MDNYELSYEEIAILKELADLHDIGEAEAWLDCEPNNNVFHVIDSLLASIYVYNEKGEITGFDFELMDPRRLELIQKFQFSLVEHRDAVLSEFSKKGSPVDGNFQAMKKHLRVIK